MSVKDILEANKKFQQKYQRIKVPASNKWAIVTCCDRRLSGLLEAAMGFRPGEAHIIRTAGGTITRFDNSVIRSLSLLILHENLREIAVVGHSGCLTGINSAQLTGAMEKAGINRQLTGDDFREFFGLSGNPTTTVNHVVDKIAKSGLIPTGINIHGFVIDTASGRISHICSHVVDKIDVADALNTNSNLLHGQTHVMKIRTQNEVRGQKKVSQFTGIIEVPKSVRTSVESVKVPVNIRTPIRKIQVPTKIRTHDRNIDVPTEVKKPERNISLSKVGIDFKEILNSETTRKSRQTPERRGQSQGSWDSSSSRSKSQEKHQPANRKYCPRCGAEYYPHVELCVDCRIHLVSKEQYKRSRERQIRPVIDQKDRRRSTRDDRGRSIGNFRNRR